jgi:drug/metabolite transporter (DMT)-like permease
VTRGALLVTGAALCWSSGGLIARLVTTDPWTTNVWRGGSCALALVLVVWIVNGRGTAEQWRRIGWAGVAVAVCLAVASTSFILALARTSVANALILMSVGPYVTGLLGWVLLGERVRFRTWVTMAVAMGGAALMVSNSYARGAVAGDFLALMMAAAFATATVLVRRHPTILMTPAAALGAGLTCLFALPMAAPLRVSTRDMALLTVFGIGQFAVGFLLFTVAARLIPAAETSLIGMIETVLGPLWVWLVLGENPGLVSLLGGALIVGALLTHALLDLLDPRPRRGVPPA